MVKVKVAFDSLWPHGLYSPWNSPGQNAGVGSLSLLQGSSQPRDRTQVYPHYRWILYQLSHKGNPRILEWVACPFARGSSRPRNGTGVSCIAGGFFTNWAIREAPINGVEDKKRKVKWYYKSTNRETTSYVKSRGKEEMYATQEMTRNICWNRKV